MRAHTCSGGGGTSWSLVPPSVPRCALWQGVGYCGRVTNQTQGGPSVSTADLALLEAELRPGALYSVATLYERYSELMAEAGRPVAHKTALGHALRAAGWQSKRLRRRINGKPTDVASWFVPGPGAGDEEDHRRVLAVMDDLGEGEHRESEIVGRYAQMGRREGWRGMLGEARFLRLLTTMGYVRTTHRGIVYRIVLARKDRTDQPSRFFQG